MNSIVVFSPILAKNLLDKGYTMVAMDRNDKKPKDFVFVFKNEKNLQNLLNDYIAKKQ